MVKLGLLMTKFITVPILIVFAIWCLYHIGKGFREAHVFYRENGRFMTEEEKRNRK